MLKYLDMNHHSTRWTCSARQARHLYISFGLSSLGHISNVDVMYGPDTNQTIASLTHEIILLIQFGIWKWWMLAFTWSTNGKLNHNQQNKYCLRLFRVRFRLCRKADSFQATNVFHTKKSCVLIIDPFNSNRDSWISSLKCLLKMSFLLEVSPIFFMNNQDSIHTFMTCAIHKKRTEHEKNIYQTDLNCHAKPQILT